MSDVKSLGSHKPAALEYLIAEDLLPKEPSKDAYDWLVSNDGDVEDEILSTKSCVVWSRNGVRQRVFRFAVEGQDVKQALLTKFLEKTSTREESQPDTSNQDQLASNAASDRFVAGGVAKMQRALVVLLQSHAHIYFLRGSSYTVNLSIEVERAWALPVGLLLQRKQSSSTFLPPTPVPPSAPHNSFFSSQNAQWSSPRVEYTVQTKSFHTSARTSTGIPGIATRSPTANQPRLFVLRDPAAGIGLVVEPSAKQTLRSVSSPLVGLSQEEEVLYVSSSSEGSVSQAPASALVIVVTVNRSSNAYNVWQALDLDKGSAQPSERRPKKRMSSYRRTSRRSSYNTAFNSGATTPLHHQQAVTGHNVGLEDIRSFAGFTGRSNRLSESMLLDQDEKAVFPQLEQQKRPGRTSSFRGDRRTTSMMARSELSSQDAGTFPDVTRDPLGATGSFTTAGGLGGQSFGVSNDRLSFSKPRTSGRYSMPGDASFLSDVQEVTLDEDIDDLFAVAHSSSGGAGSLDPFDSFQRHLTLVKAFHLPFADHGASGSLPAPTSDCKIVLQGPHAMSKKSGNPQSMSLYLLQCQPRNLYEVHMSVCLCRRTGQERAQGKRSKEDELILLQDRYDARLRQHSILDIVKVSDGPSQAVVALQQTSSPELHMIRLSNGIRHRQGLHIHCLHPKDIQLSLPTTLLSGDAHILPAETAKPGLSTVSSSQYGSAVALTHAGSHGRFDIAGSHNTYHRCRVLLRCRNVQVLRLLRLCRSAMTQVSDNDLECSWWYVRQHYFEGQERHDWEAAVVLLLALILTLVDPLSKCRIAPDKLEAHTSDLRSRFAVSRAPSPWDWVHDFLAVNMDTRHVFGSSALSSQRYNDQSLIKCVCTTDDFLSTGGPERGRRALIPQGERADSSRESRLSVLRSLVVGLHELQEEQRLCMASTQDEPELRSILALVARWTGLPALEEHYGGLDERLEALNQTTLVTLSLPSPITSDGTSDEDMRAAKLWLDVMNTHSSYQSSLLQSSTAHFQLDLGQSSEHQTGMSYAAFLGLVLCTGKRNSRNQAQVEGLLTLGIKLDSIELLPEMLASASRDAMCRVQRSPPTRRSRKLLTVADRDDLKLLFSGRPDGIDSIHHTPEPVQHVPRDMQSVCKIDEHHTVPSIRRVDDGDSLLRHVYREDKRWHEASKLIDPVRVASTVIQPEPGMTEAAFLDAQKEKAQLVYQRTMALPSGQAVMRFGNVRPIMTERVKISTFNTTCSMQPSNNSVSADKSNFTEEKVGWAFFHAGVNAGLQISPDAAGIDTSWIVLNKPPELGNRHAGLLMALGLNGHLRKMAKWLSFKYLTNKHSMTSVGLLLGLSASHLGSMDSLVTRLLSVHISKLLPVGAAELNLSPLTQTAGIVGVGLLYYDSQHRRMSEVMLSEVEVAGTEESDSGHTDHRDEAYRLAAGFALGLINLGKGANLRALHDLNLVERLLAVAIGPREITNVHILDRATAGATLAIALIFMKTQNRAVAKEVDVPTSFRQYETIRPDLLMLRTVAKWLIMWDDIMPSLQWVKNNSPKEWLSLHEAPYRISVKDSENIPFFNIVAGLCWAIALKYAGTNSEAALSVLTHYHDAVRQMIKTRRIGEDATFDEHLANETLVRWENHLQLSLATVAAGSGRLSVLRTLRLHHADLSGKSFGQHQTTAMAIGLLFMGYGRYTLGTSKLAVAAMLIAFYPLLPSDVLDNRAHLQALRHFWVFAAEARCIIPRDVETRDVLEVPIQIHLRAQLSSEVGNGDNRMQSCSPETSKAPILLPDLETISRIEVASPHHWPVTLDFENNTAHLDAFRRHQTVFLKKKPLLSQVKGAFGVAITKTTSAHGPFPRTASAMTTGHDIDAVSSAVRWISDLPAFRKLAVDILAAEIIPVFAKRNSPISALLDERTTAVDDVLVLAADVEGDDAWKLQMLKSFMEREGYQQQEDADPDLTAEEWGLRETRWLRCEWLQGLRTKIAKRAGRFLAEMTATKQNEEQRREDDMFID